MGNVLLSILFALLMDFVINRVTQEGEEGLDWSNGKKLADKEYAYHAVLLCKTSKDLQRMLNRMHVISKKTGLKVKKKEREREEIRPEYAQRDKLRLTERI